MKQLINGIEYKICPFCECEIPDNAIACGYCHDQIFKELESMRASWDNKEEFDELVGKWLESNLKTARKGGFFICNKFIDNTIYL